MGKPKVLHVEAYHAALPDEAFKGYRVLKTDTIEGAKRHIDGFHRSIDAYVIGSAMPSNPNIMKAVESIWSMREDNTKRIEAMVEDGTINDEEGNDIIRIKNYQTNIIDSLVNRGAAIELTEYLNRKLWIPKPVLVYSGEGQTVPMQKSVPGAEVAAKTSREYVQNWLAENVGAWKTFKRAFAKIAEKRVF